MKLLNEQLIFLINLALVHSKIVRSFDTGLGNGLGFNDFIILYLLGVAPERKLRRIDLAEKMSVSASGITRMLLPMEKIGLVAREASKHDARVSFVKLAPGGKRVLEEAVEQANLKSQELLPSTVAKGFKKVSDLFPLFSFHQWVQ